MTTTPQNNNTPTETITLNWFEVNALLKLLHFVKFKCDDFEADIFRGIPLINEVFRKVLAIAPDREYRYTTLNSYIMEMIEARLTDNEYYNNLTDKEKEAYLAVLAYPYPLKKEE